MGKNLRKILDNPGAALRRASGKITSAFRAPEFVGAAENRSDSDNGRYVASVTRAVKSYRHFANFKRDPHYHKILEHVSREQGQAYLDITRQRDPKLFDQALETVLKSDEVGNPIKTDFPGLGPLSTTTLRYVKVASDIKTLFGSTAGFDIAEIGCGYGGQCIVLDSLLGFDRYHLFDLPMVNQLASKYLESFVMRGAYTTQTLNSTAPREYDLVISNYAFSELPRHIEQTYIRKVLANSKRGYLTMNSGRGGRRDAGKMTIEELTEALPPFEIREEIPKTHADNYIIVWGHDTSANL